MRVARLVVVASLVGLFLCSLTSRSSAQVTTSTVRGTVKTSFLTANRTRDLNPALHLQEEVSRAARRRAAQSRGLGWSRPKCIVSNG